MLPQETTISQIWKRSCR